MKRNSLFGMVLVTIAAAIFFTANTSFTKPKNETALVPAVVFTKSVNNITSTTATCSYRITVQNVSQAKQIGVLVAKGPAATVKTTSLNFYTTYGIKAIGDYVTNIKGLSPATKMYARAYIKVDTAYVYGNAVEFTTLPPAK
jgi:hypothetical protein